MGLGEQFWRRPQSVWLRKAIFQIHLWTGIAIGLYVIAISVSGSALFFRSKILQAAPGRRIVAGSGPLLSKDELAAAAEKAYPKYTVSRIWQGTIPGQEVEIWLLRGHRQKQRIFDPYTGKDLGESVPYSLQAITWLLDLHVNLLTGPKGRIVNGVGAILLTMLCLSGAVIWWPGVANWRRSLSVNLRANWKRLNWDLHSAIGFWAFAFVFMWSFTGIYLVFPTPFQTAIQRFLPTGWSDRSSSRRCRRRSCRLRMMAVGFHEGGAGRCFTTARGIRLSARFMGRTSATLQVWERGSCGRYSG